MCITLAIIIRGIKRIIDARIGESLNLYPTDLHVSTGLIGPLQLDSSLAKLLTTKKDHRFQWPELYLESPRSKR